jgi:hypothetical protein
MKSPRGHNTIKELNPALAEYADIKRIELNTKHLFPVDVIKIANKIGNLQCFHNGEFGYELQTLVSIGPNSNPIFIVNDYAKSILILRELVARCIGEYLIHTDVPEIEYGSYQKYIFDELNEADEFAYHFLMPEDEVKNKIIEGYSATDLADYFWVSVHFVRERLDQLGL